MKPYMIFSRDIGPQEGATLIIAHSVREARKLAWRQSGLDFDDFTDMAVRLIRDTHNVLPLADQGKMRQGIPHIIDDPASCAVCGYWGAGLTTEGLCANCNSDPGEKLITLIKNWKADQ